MALPTIDPGQWVQISGSYIFGQVWKGNADGTTNPSGQTIDALCAQIVSPASGEMNAKTANDVFNSSNEWTRATYDTKRGEFWWAAQGGHGF